LSLRDSRQGSWKKIAQNQWLAIVTKLYVVLDKAACPLLNAVARLFLVTPTGLAFGIIDVLQNSPATS
jgi:hypothetical protein